jgi:hypothetical protein
MFRKIFASLSQDVRYGIRVLAKSPGLPLAEIPWSKRLRVKPGCTC